MNRVLRFILAILILPVGIALAQDELLEFADGTLVVEFGATRPEHWSIRHAGETGSPQAMGVSMREVSIEYRNESERFASIRLPFSPGESVAAYVLAYGGPELPTLRPAYIYLDVYGLVGRQWLSGLFRAEDGAVHEVVLGRLDFDGPRTLAWQWNLLDGRPPALSFLGFTVYAEAGGGGSSRAAGLYLGRMRILEVAQ